MSPVSVPHAHARGNRKVHDVVSINQEKGTTASARPHEGTRGRADRPAGLTAIRMVLPTWFSILIDM